MPILFLEEEQQKIKICWNYDLSDTAFQTSIKFQITHVQEETKTESKSEQSIRSDRKYSYEVRIPHGACFIKNNQST